MEPEATSLLVARESPLPKTAYLGQGQGAAQPGWIRNAFLQTQFFKFVSCFMLGLCLMGYAPWFAITTTYALGLAVLCRFLWRLMRHNGGGDLESSARERRRVRLAACAVSLALGGMAAVHVVSVAPSLALALKVALRVLAGLAMGLAFYFLFALIRARAKDAGRWPEKDLHELSPEQRV